MRSNRTTPTRSARSSVWFRAPRWGRGGFAGSNPVVLTIHVVQRTYFRQMSLEKFDETFVRTTIASAYCRSDAIRKLGLHPNGTGARVLNALLEKFQINIDHFDRGKKNRRYQRTIKLCPVCSKQFSVGSGQKKEKVTCSVSCSNTYFRSGEANGSHLDKQRRIQNGERVETYSEICWKHHPRKCVVCNECLIVEAHHHNGDHDDNRPENFVPLCPTHHQYWHSRHRHLIQRQVDDYVTNFMLVWQNGSAPLS